MTRGSGLAGAASTRAAGDAGRRARSAPGRWWRRVWAGAAAAAVLWSLLRAGLPGGEVVNRGGWSQVRRFLAASLDPALSADFVALSAHATLVTLAFAALGTALSLVIGVVGGVLGSEVWWETLAGGSGRSGSGHDRSRGGRSGGGGSGPWLAVRGVLAFPRAIHEIIWGLLLVAILGLDPLVGILAIGIPFGAMVAKVFSEILDETPRGALEALRAAGARPLAALLYGLLPRAFPDLLSYAFYRFECSIRSAAVLGIVGAGGLGYELLLSLQSLRWEQMWTLLYALVLLTGLTDLWSGLLRRRLGSSHRVELGFRDRSGREGPRRAARSDEVGTAAARRPRRSRWLTGSVLAALAILAFSALYLDAAWGKLASERTGRLALEILREALPPSTGGLGLSGFVEAGLDTLAMSILAMVVAGVGGLLFSFPAAHNFLLPGGILQPEGDRSPGALLGTAAFGLTRLMLLLLRAVPAPIWALVLLFVFFPGILPGALALGLYTLGVLGRLMAEVTENLDARPLRALRAQGASGGAVFLYGVLPATASRNAGYLLYRWEVAIRATAMVGVVGAGGLGRVLQDQLSSFDYPAVTATILTYVALTFVVDLLSARVRRDLR